MNAMYTLTLLLCMTPLDDKSSAADGETWAVQAGREALRDAADFPWYDPERDAVQRIDVQPPSDVAGRQSKWNQKPWNWSFPHWLGQLLIGTGWTILAIALISVLYFLIRAFFLESWTSRGGRGSEIEPLRGDIDRIEALPFQLQRPQSDLLAEARRYYDAGDFARAIVYLYSYQLVELDKHQRIRLSKGKTNRQYLREVRPNPGLWQLLRRSMLAFEDVFFGHHPLDRLRFEQCWLGLDEFHRELEPVHA